MGMQNETILKCLGRMSGDRRTGGVVLQELVG
jgi:hypothetical protein